MEKTVFIDFCAGCDSNNKFIEYKLRARNFKLHLIGFSFSGGGKYYTIQEVLVFFGIRRVAKVGSCFNCHEVRAKCPYCSDLLVLERDCDSQRCGNCERKFYLSV